MNYQLFIDKFRLDINELSISYRRALELLSMDHRRAIDNIKTNYRLDIYTITIFEILKWSKTRKDQPIRSSNRCEDFLYTHWSITGNNRKLFSRGGSTRNWAQWEAIAGLSRRYQWALAELPAYYRRAIDELDVL